MYVTNKEYIVYWWYVCEQQGIYRLLVVRYVNNKEYIVYWWYVCEQQGIHRLLAVCM